MTQPPERITRREMAQLLAPLTVLPGGDRLNKPAIEAYYLAFRSFYPFEMQEALRQCFLECSWFPTPKDIQTRLMSHRRNLGTNALEKLEQQHRDLLQLEAGESRGELPAQLRGQDEAPASAEAEVRHRRRAP